VGNRAEAGAHIISYAREVSEELSFVPRHARCAYLEMLVIVWCVPSKVCKGDFGLARGGTAEASKKVCGIKYHQDMSKTNSEQLF
jgi:hypothetical protein